jgi:transposase-like protein
MAGKRRRYSAEFKAKAVCELLEGNATLSEVASKYDVNPTMLSGWRKQLVDNASEVFSTEKTAKERREAEEKHESEVDNLNRIIGSLTVERDYLQRSFRKAAGRDDN